MKKTLALTLALLSTLIFAGAQSKNYQSPQQGDNTLLFHEYIIDQGVRIGILENEVREIKSGAVAPSEDYAALQSKLETRVQKSLDANSRSISILLAIIGILVTVVGLIIPLITYFVGANWFRNEKAKIEKIKKSAEACLEQIKGHEKSSGTILSQLQDLSNKQPGEAKKPRDLESANRIAVNPDATQFQRDWAKALIDYHSENYAEAINKFNGLLADYPDDLNFNDLSYVYYCIGDCYFGMKNYTASIAYSDSAISLNPRNRNGWVNKIFALQRTDELDRALGIAETAISVIRDDGFLWCCRANALKYMERYDEALPAVEEAIGVDDEYGYAWCCKGDVLFDLKRYDEALEAVGKAIKLNDNDDYFWACKGKILDNMGEHERARDAFDRSLAINPQYQFALLRKGNSLSRIGREDDALDCYDRAIAIDESYPYVWMYKAMLTKDLNRYEESLAAFMKYDSLSPGDEYVLQQIEQLEKLLAGEADPNEE